MSPVTRETTPSFNAVCHSDSAVLALPSSNFRKTKDKRPEFCLQFSEPLTDPATHLFQKHGTSFYNNSEILDGFDEEFHQRPKFSLAELKIILEWVLNMKFISSVNLSTFDFNYVFRVKNF